jgi:Na+-translocating ferredoxin:NAD+ oxidoreductase RnfC subunit
VNRQTDNNNCGTCGNVCPAGQICSNGTCALSCQSGLFNCSGVCVNRQTDRFNCGTCGNVCPAHRPHPRLPRQRRGQLRHVRAHRLELIHFPA